MTKTLKIEDNKALELYSSASKELKEILEQTFGKEFFNQKITDKIKTWKHILNYSGKKEINILPWKNPKNKQQISQNAYAKIQLISEVLNEGWVPNFNNSSEYKYYPYFIKNTPVGWAYSGYYYSASPGTLGFGFYYKTSNLAECVGTQFLEIYKEYFPE